MKAPEKIYIEPYLDSMWGMAERSCESEIEYTRTDAFIEKACDWLNKFYNEDTHSYLIHEDIEDFKKYMENKL